jgi:tetratricopeptide (TPR) repeat protein
MNRTNRNILLIAAGGLALLIVAYSNHFYNGFHFDDFHAVVNNVFIRDIKNIPAYFVDPKMFSADPAHWGLRSLVTTTLAIDYWLGGGLDPFYFQLDTFLWHIALCAFLYFLYKNLLKTVFDMDWAAYLAIAATLLFGLHTVDAETLNYVIARSDVLSTFMIVLSFYTYIAWPGKRKYGLYIIPALLGVFAKETMLVLVILLFFYILLFEKKLSLSELFTKKHWIAMPKALWQIAPLIVILLAAQIYALTRITSIPGITNPLLPYLLTQSFVWVRYFIAFFCPVNLSADSDWTVLKNMFDERIIVGCVFFIGLVITIFKTSTKSETRPVAFGLIWFAAALLPTSLAPFAEVTNDHRMYFPFIGLAFSVISYGGLLLRRYQLKLKGKWLIPLMTTIFLCVILLNAYGVWQRNQVWENEETLWRDVVKQSPENGRGLMNYGIALMTKRDYIMAGFYFKQAKQYLPDYNLIYVNTGILNQYMNNPVEAEHNFKQGIDLNDNYFGSYFFYAKFLMHTGRFADAKPVAERAFELNPYDERTSNLLMVIYYHLQLWEAMQKMAQHKAAINPGENVTQLYLSAAKNHSEIVIDENGSMPQSISAFLDLSLQFYNQGEYLKCIAACNEALKLSPDYAYAYNNIAAADIKLKQWNDAIAAAKKALAINPKYPLATGNLNYAESQLSSTK